MQMYKNKQKYESGLARKTLVEELQLSSSRIPDIKTIYLYRGDCGSCPSCACIKADFQVLAVIEAPATVPIMVMVGGISLTS